MNDHPNDPFDELMRRALNAEADRIEPADGLHEIQARVRTQRKPVSRRPWAITAGAAVLGTAAAVGAFAVLSGDNRNAGDTEVAGPGASTSSAGAAVTPQPTAEQSVPPGYPTTTPSAPEPAVTTKPTRAGTLEPITSKSVPVYWLGDSVGATTGPKVRLYRTFTEIKGRPAFEALQLMTAAKSDDPDYQSPWVGATVGSVSRSDGLITVDFKQLPKQRLTSDVAGVALQQLVYTVQGAMQLTEPVEVTAQGKPATQLFGMEVKQPLSRAKTLDVQALIWVESPRNGAIVRTPLKVSGIAAAFEAQVNWRITSESTRQVVAEGPASTKEAGMLLPYSFTVKALPAGSYRLDVFEFSAEDGRQTSTDSKTIYVK